MNREQRILLGAVILVIVAFLAGFGWQYSKARSLSADLTTSNEELTFKRLEAALAAATIEAYRGNYEIARQLSSQFFTGLQNDMQRAPEDRQTELRAIMNQRDAIITAASRSDPQTASLLGQLYSTYRVAFGEAPVQAQPASPTPAAPPTTTQ